MGNNVNYIKISELKSINELPETEKIENIYLNGAGQTSNYKIQINEILNPVYSYVNSYFIDNSYYDKLDNKIIENNQSITSLNNDLVELKTSVKENYQLIIDSVGKKTEYSGEIFNDYENNKAGLNAHAEGNECKALGDNSHAEGFKNTAEGDNSHAEGAETLSYNKSSHAEGYQSKANGTSSHAEGKLTNANGGSSHAEGFKSISTGVNSHAEGESTNAKGQNSHTEGKYTITENQNEHAEGIANNSSAGETQDTKTISSVGIGTSNTARKNAIEVMQNGDIYIINAGNYDGKLLNGKDKKPNVKTLQELLNNSGGETSNSVGKQTSDNGEIFNDYENNYAYLQAHAEGEMTSASGEASHAEGLMTQAVGFYSHAEGGTTTSTGVNSHAEGDSTISNGESSHAEGSFTITNNEGEHAEGKYNKSNKLTISSIGIGKNEDNRKNAIEVLSTGNTYIYNIGNYNGTELNNAMSLQDVINNMLTTIADLTSKVETLMK